MLEEERARADALVAEIGELEGQIGDQRARVCNMGRGRRGERQVERRGHLKD
jgi:hypothetical protein